MMNLNVVSLISFLTLAQGVSAEELFSAGDHANVALLMMGGISLVACRKLMRRKAE